MGIAGKSRLEVGKLAISDGVLGFPRGSVRDSLVASGGAFDATKTSGSGRASRICQA